MKREENIFAEVLDQESLQICKSTETTRDRPPYQEDSSHPGNLDRFENNVVDSRPIDFLLLVHRNTVNLT